MRRVLGSLPQTLGGSPVPALGPPHGPSCFLLLQAVIATTPLLWDDHAEAGAHTGRPP